MRIPVTVLMPVHNGGEYLAGAVQSVLAQTFHGFEFLIIDDCSIDGSLHVAASFDDPRIRIIPNDRNMGLAMSLNKGFDLARGKYIARMDSDDVCRPDRLERQLAWLESHPAVGACGSWVRYIGLGRGKTVRYYSDSSMVKASLLFDPPMAHPAVMLRRDLFLRHGLLYDPTFHRAQDYDLWERASHHFPLSNVPRVLLDYRIHPEQAGGRTYREQQGDADRTRLRQLNAMGMDPGEDEMAVHRIVSELIDIQPTRELILRIEGWLGKLKEANAKSGTYPEPHFSLLLG
ncbi:MAG: glycosyltransferase, partial [Deltaproteobacteria bacterium]